MTLAACATTGAPKERSGYAIKRSYEAKEGASRQGGSLFFCKNEDKKLGDVYERVARQELDRCEMLHAQAVRIIREHGREFAIKFAIKSYQKVPIFPYLRRRKKKRKRT